MSLPAGDVAYGFYDFDGMDLMKTGTQSKMKRPRSPAGVFEGSRSISDGELSGEESNSYCSSSSLSSSNSKSLEDFSSLFVFDKDELSSATATSFESIYEDHAPLTNIITDSFISFEEDSADTVSSGADEISAKRRKKLSALVPYPRIPAPPSINAATARTITHVLLRITPGGQSTAMTVPPATRTKFPAST